MQCKLCGSNHVKVIYNDKIRNGAINQYTESNVPIYFCADCESFFHEAVVDNANYYESSEYRDSLEGGSEESRFYELHDKESMDKFRYTGTTVFRNKLCADVGCGAGAFLDYVNGVANKVIAIEPSAQYRETMQQKGFATFPYASEAAKIYADQVDVVTSFDVIEHVDSPLAFLKDVKDLLKTGGQAIIGTPSDAPLMRELLGHEYEQKLLFSVQHLWILSEKGLRYCAEKAGFSECHVRYFQRYGLSNTLAWLRDRRPEGDIRFDYITDAMDSVFKAELEQEKKADYIVLYATK